MKTFFTLLTILWFVCFHSMAQTIKISPDGRDPKCPGTPESYSVLVENDLGEQFSKCSFKWKIKKGKFYPNQGNYNSLDDSYELTTSTYQVIVLWDNTTTKGDLSVQLENCEKTSLNVSRSTGSVIIKSINNVTPSQIMVNNVAKTSHHIDYCSTAPVTLAIDRLIIPNTPSSSNPYYPNTLYVDMYEWTLPTGWRTSDNKTGTFTTPSYSISVIPAAGAGG